MSWREILNPNLSDFSDKSQNDLFGHYCHKDREIEKKKSNETDTIAVPDYFDELEQKYYFNLVEFMESQKHGMDRETAEREAGAIVAEYRLRKKQRKQ